MSWTLHRLCFRLRSPMHVGWGKVGNIQRTRPYLLGRTFWGALTMRLTRMRHGPAGPVDDSRLYQAVGQEILRDLAWTYFYPALYLDGQYKIQWPWSASGTFEQRHLRSYASTALVYPQQAAAEATLHEVEFISPHTLDSAGHSVYLVGYVMARHDAAEDWQIACRRLQFGGERSYGWGDVALEALETMEAADEVSLFDGAGTVMLSGEQPVVTVESNGRISAHVRPVGPLLAGEPEPLVGREWRSHNSRNRHSGAHVEYAGIYLMPGATALQTAHFAIGPFGLWSLE